MRNKDEIQQEIIDKIVKNQLKGVVLSSVRSGKTRILLRSIQYFKDSNTKVLVLYPNIDILQSWKNEMDLINYYPNITFSTFISIDKVKDEKWDIIIADEGHLIPEENILPKFAEMCKKCRRVIIASGTYSSKTLETLKESTGLDLIVEYSTEQAIKDGIVSDYSVVIHQFNLDNITPVQYGKAKKWTSTELKECNRLSRKVDTSYGKEKMFHALNRMRFINSCPSLIKSVNNWIEKNKEKRFLLFTGDENVGKNYNLPMFNSKSEDDKLLKDFQKGKINQLCLIKKGSSGVTYPNLDTVLVTAINSNGENLFQALGRSLLDDTEHSYIHIFVSTQQFQQKWLNSSLEGIPKEKIQWINIQ